MGARALEFSRAHPDADPGYAAATAKLEQLVARASEAVTLQRSGIVDARAASARRRELRRMLSVHIAHLAQVGQEASVENHELAKTFRFKPAAQSILAFRSAAGTMAREAEAHRETLVKYGLSAPVLEELGQLLAEFDAAVALGNSGRATHLRATEELKKVAAGISRTVKVMDGRNRQRFKNDSEGLREWIGASTVLGKPRGTPASSQPNDPPTGTTPSTGEVRPAA